MNKVLHVGLIAPGYSNAGLMKAFFANGFTEYTLFDFQLNMFEFGKDAMQLMLIREAERIKPDIIFMQIQGSDILDVATFKKIAEISFTVNYTFDIRMPEQTEWLYNLAPVLGLICFSNQRDVNICNSRGYLNVMALQSSADMDVYKPIGLFMRTIFVSFIGTNYARTNHNFPMAASREEMVKRLTHKFNPRFGVWGMGWDDSQFTNHGQEQRIYSTSTIAINQNNFNEESYCSDRIWRIMGCGAMCLTSYFKGIEKLFTRRLHLDWWHTLGELEEKVEYYLSNPGVAKRIAHEGMEHVRKKHTWSARVEEMLDFLGELKLFKDFVYAKTPDPDACTKAGAHVIDGSIPGPLDEKYNNRVCDCGKLRWIWAECGCDAKAWQLRAQENI